jgi:hypothetical protein
VSDTPRTDAATYLRFDGVVWVKGVEVDFARELERELVAAKAERDEARRDACVSEARYQEERAYPLDIPRDEWIQRDARSIAAERGWDCFDAPHTNATDVPVQNGGA